MMQRHRYVYIHQPGQPWPTLGEMIERGQVEFLSVECGAARR